MRLAEDSTLDLSHRILLMLAVTASELATIHSLQNDAMLINHVPEPALLPRDFHNDLVRMPDITGGRLSASQVPCIQGTEFCSPSRTVS